MSLGVGHVSSHSESYLPEGLTCTTLLICALSPGGIKRAPRWSHQNDTMGWRCVYWIREKGKQRAKNRHIGTGHRFVATSA